MKNMEEIKKEIKETFTKTKYNYEEQLNIALRNANLNAYAINDTAQEQILIQHGDDEDKYAIITYFAIAELEKDGLKPYDIVRLMIEHYKLKCLIKDAFIVEDSKHGKYMTYEVDKPDCIGQWDPDTNILTIRRKDTK